MNDQALRNDAQEFRILSIDGGGIKGVFPAAFLAELENSLSDPIYRYFDLIAGTSTGGIIALGLGLGLTAAEITTFYENYGTYIFPAPALSAPKRLLRQLLSSKYSAQPLQIALDAVFKDSTLGGHGGWTVVRRRAVAGP